ncbi:MAG: hypothetical protein JW924_04975 [Fusobacteriaceae bacterium]|nr:hypothetical protein [Fusobacteriaceae bacterium]
MSGFNRKILFPSGKYKAVITEKINYFNLDIFLLKIRLNAFKINRF